MWELRVEGRLIDDPQNANGSTTQPNGTTQSNNGASSTTSSSNAAAQQRNQLPKRKFSSFFKSLVIELDKDIYGPDNHLVEWHRTPSTNETDGFQVRLFPAYYISNNHSFQVKRPGDKDVNCTILLLLDYQPMKFKVSPKLSKVLGIGMETRAKIIETLWQYIKSHKLQVSL